MDPSLAVMHPSLSVVDTPHGRGLRVTAPIRAGERLLYAPATAQLDGVDSDALATTLLKELEAHTHTWLASLPRSVAFSAAGCDDATTAALCALAGGGGGDCAFVRCVARDQGVDTQQRWARSFVVANALRIKSGHLRLAPFFLLLNHRDDGGLEPTEESDGALSLTAVCDLQPGDDVCINYGHGTHGGAGVLHRYGYFPVESATEFNVFGDASDDALLESLRRRLALDVGVTLRSDILGPNEALELASLLPVLDAASLTSLWRRLDRGEDGDDASLSTAQASLTKSASSCDFSALFAAETDRDIAYAWLLRRTPQLRVRGRAHCCLVLEAALSASRANAASATGGAAVAGLRANCASYRRAREALLEGHAAPLRCCKV